MAQVLIAPNAYKGSLTPLELARAMAAGARRAGHEPVLAPIADGGDGTLAALNAALGGNLRACPATGPLGEPVEAAWLDLGVLAVAELASASGIAHIPPGQLDPLGAHTTGLGEVLADCRRRGKQDIVVTVGGSASTDGGSGALRALGARFRDADGRELRLGGRELFRLRSCDLSGLLRFWGKTRLRVATDVDNPLLGEQGAATVFGPQKGATGEQVVLLEQGLERLAVVLESETGRRMRDVPGAGAAGGTAFGLACALGAEIVPGFRWLSELIGLEDKVAACDLVLTAEGRLDSQSLRGKAVGELASLCRSRKRRLWVFPALVEPDLDWTERGVELVVPVAQPGKQATREDVEEAVAEALSRAGSG